MKICRAPRFEQTKHALPLFFPHTTGMVTPYHIYGALTVSVDAKSVADCCFYGLVTYWLLCGHGVLKKELRGAMHSNARFLKVPAAAISSQEV